MNELTTKSTNSPADMGFLNPSTFQGGAWGMAEMLANSELVPKAFKGKAAEILIAMQMGHELGLKPMQSLQNIAVVNGKPTLWGDSVVALCYSSGLLADITEEISDTSATVTVTRVGQAPHSVTFSVEDAKKAGLWGKQGPWTQYPKRMLKNRARAFALRDKFADVLSGFGITEEEKDRVVETIESKLVNPKATDINAMVNQAVAQVNAPTVQAQIEQVDTAKLAEQIVHADDIASLDVLAKTIAHHRQTGAINDDERTILGNAFKARKLYLTMRADIAQVTLDEAENARRVLYDNQAKLSPDDFESLDNQLDHHLNQLMEQQ